VYEVRDALGRETDPAAGGLEGVMNRDMVVWWVGLIGGVITACAAQADLFPPAWKSGITIAALIVSAVSGWMKTSPLPGK